MSSSKSSIGSNCASSKESIKNRKEKSQRASKNSEVHPVNCFCNNCCHDDDDDDAHGACAIYLIFTRLILIFISILFSDNCGDSSKKTSDHKCFEMASASSEKNLKNYLYDNQELQESKDVKCSEESFDFGPGTEVWLLQCPKNFDPKTLSGTSLGKMGKEAGCSVECTADKFSGVKTLAVIKPERAAEYQLICDNIKIVSCINLREVSRFNFIAFSAQTGWQDRC